MQNKFGLGMEVVIKKQILLLLREHLREKEGNEI